jgi:predicted transcriptional regulator
VTKEQFDFVLQKLRSWPEEDQDEIAEFAREIEARRKGIYVMSEEERVAVREGWDQAERGQFVSEEEMAAFWQKRDIR